MSIVYNMTSKKKDLWNSSWKLVGQIHVMVFWKSDQSEVQMLDVVGLIYFVDQIIRNGRFINHTYITCLPRRTM